MTPSFFGRFPGQAEQADSEQDVSGPLVFAGVEDRFFAGVFLPDSPDTKAAKRARSLDPARLAGREKDKPKPLAVRLGSLSAKPLDFRLFVAPKDLDVLRP